MIVGTAVCKLLDGISITVNGNEIVALTDMGNQDALNKFIAFKDNNVLRKFPLIFYVINNVKEYDGWSYCNTDLIIMTNTDINLLYKDRANITYKPYIEPIYNKVVKLLKSNNYIDIIESDIKDKYSYVDVPNFGASRSKIESGNSTKSIATEFVDARIMKFNFKIKANCI